MCMKYEMFVKYRFADFIIVVVEVVLLSHTIALYCVYLDWKLQHSNGQIEGEVLIFIFDDKGGVEVLYGALAHAVGLANGQLISLLEVQIAFEHAGLDRAQDRRFVCFASFEAYLTIIAHDPVRSAGLWQ